MPHITVRTSLLATVATAALVVAVLLLANAPSSRADVPALNGSTLTWTVSNPASLTITPRDAAGCDGAPCVEITDPESPAQPAGVCESRSTDHLALRCPTSGVGAVEIHGTGNLDVAMRMERPAGSACPAYAVTLQEGAASGAVAAADGCKQRIVCSQYYAGHVDADSQDDIDASCLTVNVDGVPTRTPGMEPPCTTPYHGCVPDTGGGGRHGVKTTPTIDPTRPNGSGGNGSATTAPNPISSIRLTRGGRRTLRSTVVLTKAVRFAVVVFRRSSRGRWARKQSVEQVEARRGSNRVTVTRSDGKPFSPGLYRVKAIAAVPESKLVTSNTVRIRR